MKGLPVSVLLKELKVLNRRIYTKSKSYEAMAESSRAEERMAYYLNKSHALRDAWASIESAIGSMEDISKK